MFPWRSHYQKKTKIRQHRKLRRRIMDDCAKLFRQIEGYDRITANHVEKQVVELNIKILGLKLLKTQGLILSVLDKYRPHITPALLHRLNHLKERFRREAKAYEAEKEYYYKWVA
jgi:hypothetical protein